MCNKSAEDGRLELVARTAKTFIRRRTTLESQSHRPARTRTRSQAESKALSILSDRANARVSPYDVHARLYSYLPPLTLINPHPQNLPDSPTMPPNPYRPTPPKRQNILSPPSPLNNRPLPLPLLEPLDIIPPNSMRPCTRSHTPESHHMPLINLVFQPALALILLGAVIEKR